MGTVMARQANTKELCAYWRIINTATMVSKLAKGLKIFDTAAFWSDCNTTEISSKTNCTTKTASTMHTHRTNSEGPIKLQFRIFVQFKQSAMGVQINKTASIMTAMDIYAVLTNCLPRSSSFLEMASVSL